MKIAYVYDALYPYVRGGGEKRNYELARHLAIDHEVHFVSWRYWGRSAYRRFNGLHYHGVGRPRPLYTRLGTRSISEALAFAVCLSRLSQLRHFDLIDCTVFPYFHVFTARLLSRLRREPLILTWHEYWGAYWLRYLGQLGHLARPVEFLATRMGDAHIAESELTADRLRSAGISDNRLAVIPIGIDSTQIRNVEAADLESDVIYVGRLITHKRVELLLEAVRRVRTRQPSVRCLVVGGGPEEAGLRAHAARLGLESNLTFLSSVPDERSVYALMKGSKVFVLPSSREGFGLSVLEANACGLPAVVVRSPESAAFNLVQHNTTGLVANPDATSLADAICSILERDSYRRQLAEGAQHFSGDYDWAVLAPRILDLYERVRKT